MVADNQQRKNRNITHSISHKTYVYRKNLGEKNLIIVIASKHKLVVICAPLEMVLKTLLVSHLFSESFESP